MARTRRWSLACAPPLSQECNPPGVAATAKHFPGGGDMAVDPHDEVPILRHDRQRLSRVELPPFEQAIEAGVRLVMTAHVAIPILNDGLDLPAT
ncbi:MAG: beta-N-acetylhexosaminidase, partial [Planctomycetales bacterium]|nr:beta-N-acetylhexosaminidase [Planctomycetales bacterium]NIP04361.1 beta-N-acetylhexosaminidase [Planctomycetales bacterium]